MLAEQVRWLADLDPYPAPGSLLPLRGSSGWIDEVKS